MYADTIYCDYFFDSVANGRKYFVGCDSKEIRRKITHHLYFS